MVTIQPGRADTRYGRNWCVCVGRWELVQGVFLDVVRPMRTCQEKKTTERDDIWGSGGSQRGGREQG